MLYCFKSFLIICFIAIQTLSFAIDKDMELYDANTTLVVGTSVDFPPFEFISNNKIIGFDIDIINIIAKELNMNILIRDMKFYTLIPSLESGDIQIAIAGITYTDERAKQIDLSTSYYSNKFAMLVVGEHDRINPIKPGMKIGVEEGSMMEQWLKKQRIGIEIITMDSNTTLIKSLENNDLDGVLFDAVSAKAIIKLHPYIPFNLVDLAGVAASGMSIGVMKDSPLLERINSILKQLHSNGEMAKLKAKWGL